jgi:predicted transcriptional regulator
MTVADCSGETGGKDATMARTTLDVPRELLAGYEAIARRQHRTVGAIMLDALESYLERENSTGEAGLGLPGWVGKLHDDEVTSENIDEWLQSHWTPE